MASRPATASPLVRRYRVDEFFALDAPPGGGHYELIAGVLYMVPPPSGLHNMVASRLVGVFSAYATAHPERCILFVPRTPIWAAADTYLEPDLFLVSVDRMKGMDPGRLTVADLVVEILSPGSAVYDRTAKADTYGALGVPELWLVDLESCSIEQRVLTAAAWRVAGTYAGSTPVNASVFPRLTVVPEQIFP